MSETALLDELLDELKNNPLEVLPLMEVSILVELIRYTSEKYHNNKPIISDFIFDMLYDRLKELEPKNKVLKEIGAPVNEGNKVKLPYHMGSMDKIKPETGDIEKWVNKYNGPYVISDKLDGMSALYMNRKLYTRGDGTTGSDISSLIKLIPDLKNKNLEKGLAIRGELILSKKTFEKYCRDFNDSRSAIAGIINAKNIKLDLIQHVELVCYEIIIKNEKIAQSDQYQLMEELGLKTAYHKEITNIDDEILNKLLDKRRAESNYEIDGLIVTDDHPHPRNTSGNPKNAIAFKNIDKSQIADVKVIDVEWNLSKYGKFKPRLELEPVKLSGATITYVTAHNAKYVYDNKIGPDSIIRVIRSGGVIPYILEVIDGTGAKMPDKPYFWNETETDIFLDTDETDEDSFRDINIKNISFFFKQLNIKNIDKGIITKLVDNEFDNIPLILSASIKDLKKVPGIQEKLATKLYENIHSVIDNVDLSDLIAASNIFGQGIGTSKSNLILAEYPDILEYDVSTDKNRQKLVNKLEQIKGCGPVTAKQFVDKLQDFKDFLKTVPMINYNISDNKIEDDDQIQSDEKDTLNVEDEDSSTTECYPSPKFAKGLIIVFSGFRNKDWEKILTKNGGKVTTSVSKNTNIVAVKDITNSSKITKAKDLGIQIMDMDDFAATFGLVF